MDIKKLIEEITRVMDEAIELFTKGVEVSQEKLYTKIETLLKSELETKGDVIKPSARNYKLLGQLQSDIINSIMNSEYLTSLKNYLSTFEVVGGLIDRYFGLMLDEFNPKANKELKAALIDTTINYLTEAGIGVNISDPIKEIIRINITSGGSYAELTKQLRGTLLSSNESEGIVQRYVKQIVVDSIQQYNAEYMKSLASDLKLEWYQYVGSNIVTTRDFCALMTKKRWIHICEIPSILDGVIDRHRLQLNKKGLPYGMIEGTNLSNFTIYRGGYNCRHQYYPVTESLVPQNIKNALYATAEYKAWKKAA